MAGKTAIEWTDVTWNPVTGCTKVSPGCAHCYAEAITLRFKRGGPFLPGKATIRLHPERLADPGKWRKPRQVFVNSMRDLFHEEIPFEFIRDIFLSMKEYSSHTYQILTKRPERMLEYVQWTSGEIWPDHIWAGVSVENQYWADRRIPLLRKVPCAVRFLSCEPLLKPLQLELNGIHWVIVGGESRHRARRMDEAWAIDIKDQCQEAGVAFFFKQWGGRTPKAGGRTLDSQIWDEMPVDGTSPSELSKKELSIAGPADSTRE